MAEAYSIEYILDTYELPEKLKKRLAWIAAARLDDLSIHSFDGIYTYIAELVDKFTGMYRNRSSVSLDAELSPEDTRTMHEFICRYDPDFEDEEGEYEKPLPSAAIDEVLRILEKPLDRAQFNFLVNLVLRTNGKTPDVNPEDVSEDIEGIRSRMQELADQYQLNGTIKVPPRPIGKISFNPLNIEFKNRHYNDPLEFFRKHRETYRGMTRDELYHFDSGMYHALRREGQMDQAIASRRGLRSRN